MSSAVRYQVMPPLSSEEYQELHESIKAEGVLEPIHVDEEGVVIDGHHRSKIANELGIPCPVIAHDDLSESQKRSLAFTLNLKRRHLNREQRRALGLESLRLDPIASNREHSKRTGLSDKTIRDIREKENIPEPSEVIKDYTEKNPDKPDHIIGEELGVSKNTVAKYRDCQNSEFPNFDNDNETGNGEPEPSPPAIIPKHFNEPNQSPTEQPTMEQPEHKPRAEPITNQFTSAIVDLNRVMAKFHRISENENFPRNKEKVAALHRHDLNRSISELQALADQLN